MFARVLELTSRPGKQREVVRTLRKRVVPELSQQPGFIEQFILASDAEPDRILAISLWTRHEHAEWFQRHHYSRMRRLLEPLLEFEPVTRTFNVEDGRPAARSVRAPQESRGGRG